MAFSNKTPGFEPGGVLSVYDDYITDAEPINDFDLEDFCEFDSSVSTVEETNKTNKTNKTNDANQAKCVMVCNDEFLSSIFGDPDGDLRPVVVSFTGHPNKVPKSSWFGRAWDPETVNLTTANNNYFSLAVFCPNEAREYRRQKAQFRGLYAIYFDDVGTKVDADLITLPPSWRIETSPKNFQVGYILSEPLVDGKKADCLMKAIIAKGLCDPGAGGPTARLARLPIGINAKVNHRFLCRLTEWEPDCRYSVEELVDAYDLDPNPPRKGKVSRKREFSTEVIDEDTIYIPLAGENPLIKVLKAKSLYKSELEPGKHDITCPWVHEHTEEADGGTAYFEPDSVYPTGGFHCFHGHCADRSIRDLIKFLDVSQTSARMKPTVRMIKGEIDRLADQAEQELARHNRHYQRGGLIVTVSTDPGTKNTFIKDIKRPGLLRALASVALWETFDKKYNTWVRSEPSDRLVSVVFDSSDYPHLPLLNGLAYQPYLRDDGSLVVSPGYDMASGMYGEFNADQFQVPSSPTREDAERALNDLVDLLAEFSFAEDHDRSAALSAILTATIRPSLPLAPMFHVRAPQPGSGKSYLCRTVSMFATPRSGAPTTFPHDDEECRKMLLAELLRAPPVIEFDNLTSDLFSHKSLCAALTSEYMTGRILGVSKTATVGTRTLFLSSGNNVGPVADMARRCLTINLDPRTENPTTKKYKKTDLLGDLIRDRGRYVSAALTIVRAWIIAGRPKSDCKDIGSFGAWSDLCRQPLLWLGLPDPALSLFKVMDEDPEREILGRLIKVWHKIFGSTSTMVRDAVRVTSGLCYDLPENYEYDHDDIVELREVLADIAGERHGEINRKTLGRWIKRNEGKIVDGLRFSRAPGNRAAEAWRIEVMK